MYTVLGNLLLVSLVVGGMMELVTSAIAKKN